MNESEVKRRIETLQSSYSSYYTYIDKNPNLPEAPNPLMLTKWYHSQIPIMIAEINEIEDASNLKATCRNGCASCCKLAIVLTEAESIILEYVIKQFPKEQKKSIAEKAQTAIEAYKKSGLALPSKIANSISASNKFQDDYFSLSIFCPLLNENNACSVYDYRPTACWMYRYYGNPNDCQNSANPELSFNFHLQEKKMLNSLFDMRKPKKNPDNVLRLLLHAIDWSSLL